MSEKTDANGEVDSERMAAKPVNVEGSRGKLLVCFLGVFVSYFIYGLLQEKITKTKYGEKEERFTYTLALVFVQCIVNALFAQVAMMIYKPALDTTPQSTYAVMTMSYVGAMIASNHALQYVSYPTQVLGKSVKPIPVMILGVIMAKKRYPLQKYLFVVMIVTGVALFIYKDKKGTHIDSDHTFGFGEVLLMLSLFLDGMTGGIQDRMRAEHRTQTHPMMLSANLWSVLYLGIGLILTGEGVLFMDFVMRFPHVMIQMFTFSICSAIGQNFIFMTVATFGPLTCSIITTTRKFFTILGSVIIFSHPMAPRQWMGTFLVFLGLAMDNVYGKERKNGKDPKANAK